MYFKKWFFENQNTEKDLLLSIFHNPTDTTNLLVAADFLSDKEESHDYKGIKASNFLRDYANVLGNNLHKNLGKIYKFLSIHQNQLHDMDQLHAGLSSVLVPGFKNMWGLVTIISEFLPKDIDKNEIAASSKDPLTSSVLVNADIDKYRFTIQLRSNVFEDAKGIYKVTRVNNGGIATNLQIMAGDNKGIELYYKANEDITTSLAPLNEFLALFVKRTPNYEG